MINLSNLKPAKGANKRSKLLGRGPGSGRGKTAGKGHKGQLARSGGHVPLGFEGGQMPLYRRLPKRGFNRPFVDTVAVMNVGDLERRWTFSEEVSLETLRKNRLVKGKVEKLKILGQGNLTKKLVINANMFSESAKEKIEKAGGKIVVID